MKKYSLILFLAITVGLLIYIEQNAHEQNQSFFTAIPFFGASGSHSPELQKTQAQPTKSNEICFTGEKTADGEMRITANAVRINEKLLGVAFYLDFDHKRSKYLSYKNGDFFERGDGKPFYMIRPSHSGRITAGITLKRGDALPSGNGEIISFYFDGLTDFSLSNNIAATIQNGNRKNLDEIKFTKCK